MICTGYLPIRRVQGNKGKTREMLLGLKVSTKNRGIRHPLETIREISGKLFAFAVLINKSIS